MARAAELEAQERANLRDGTDPSTRSHGFSDRNGINQATSPARDEEEGLGFTDLDDDNVDLALGDSDSDQPGPRKNSTRRSYHDEFTDNDSEGLAGEEEGFSLHHHIPK